jgi:hypothetical protein
LFVGRDGERITRGTLQSRIKRAFNRAGPDAQRRWLEGLLGLRLVADPHLGGAVQDGAVDAQR